MLGDEIGVLGKPALLEHVAQLLFAPAPPRLGRIAQAVAEPRGFGADALLPRADRIDLAVQLAEGVDALRLHLAHLPLVARQPLTDRGEQGAQPLGAGLLALLEPGLRPL